MKKSLAIALAASFVMTAAGSVFAAENPSDLKFSGSINSQYRKDDKSNGSNAYSSGLKTTLTLNMDKSLTKNLALYARFTHQTFNNDAAERMQADWANEDYNTAIDAFGFKYNNAGVDYVLGSQALTIGATGLVYDNGFLGRYALPYALKASGKSGATDLTAIYARTNYDQADNENFYVLQGQYAVDAKTSVGAFFARANYEKATNTTVDKDNMNYYGINAGYKLTDRLSFVTEYIKSNANADDKGYIGSFSYALDNKNTFGASYYRVEDQAAISDAQLTSMTTAPYSNAKGYILSYSHTVNDNTKLAVSYDTIDKINDTAKAGANWDRNRTRIGVTYNF